MNDQKEIKIPSRYLYNGKHYFLDDENKVVKLEENYHKKLLAHKPGAFGAFRKITGSALGDVLELTKFNSQFSAFARISGFALPVLDKKYVNAGVKIEPKILEKLENKFNFKIKRFDAKEYNYDYFKENDLFGGLPDGYLESENLVIEIKTAGAKKFDSWNNEGISPSYIKQAQLYSYLIGAKRFTIVACFLEEDDYNNPEWVDVNKRILKNWFFNVNEKQVEDDMETCRKWYEHYTKTGISPKWNDMIDGDLIKYLRCHDSKEWEELYLEWVKVGKAVPDYEEK
ncbi:hypothetical protein DMC14_001595 [Metamycoplasma phocicerebrale]|uniref:YqaJ viral recombinase domain-containing protein n=1 Tax=Metamycoplasma phocicerebrale TaxID=142649 RepID=A0A3Q9VA58_9BACT|nr:YqaJ viral recombinase family protein [Metamycoplasma phocicerebrale]AZZ65479.1 hypothetical protein DMC14_001595 [Metamycoplasma phocicerebrale]